ncbi:hypothetical protein [Nocardioides sp. SYSU D00038]|uniref:hypothetical protein n=1 Tax=Nocardioides sp. SYSU D00038 TaxID=2812554 RepID=UPI0019684613|nr:hypothetical protein [Nocardioides sp. SYSU D00038]
MTSTPLPATSPRPLRHTLGCLLGLTTTLLLVLSVGAVGMVGDGGRSDLLWAAVPVVGVAGVALARLRPTGTAAALLAMAATQLVVTAVALVAVVPGRSDASVLDLLWVNGGFAVLYVAAAGLCASAAGGRVTGRAR